MLDRTEEREATSRMEPTEIMLLSGAATLPLKPIGRLPRHQFDDAKGMAEPSWTLHHQGEEEAMNSLKPIKASSPLSTLQKLRKSTRNLKSRQKSTDAESGEASQMTKPCLVMPPRTNSKKRASSRPLQPTHNTKHAAPDGHCSPEHQSFIVISGQPISGLLEPEDHSRNAGSDDGGRAVNDAQPHVASIVTPSELSGLSPVENQKKFAAQGGQVQSSIGTQTKSDLTATYSEIRALYRRKMQWQKASTRLALQAQAICRGWTEGDKDKAQKLFKSLASGKGQDEHFELWLAISPLLQARDIIEAHSKPVEKRLEKLAAQTPYADFVKGVKGFGLPTLAAIIGSCVVPPHEYKSVSALWKQFGLAVYPDGTRQRLIAGLSLQENPCNLENRAVIYVLQECLLRAGSHYRETYDKRKAYEFKRNPEITKAHAHNRAGRYMAKKVLKHLYARGRK